MERVAAFEKEVGRQLSGLTVENGGPILMVQVENEYGSYGEDKPYVSAIRDIVRSAGFDKVTLFQCDWSSNFTRNGLDDLVWTMNFGTGANIDEQFQRLKELRPSAPLMCSEFWSGWFDKWGARHETRPADDMVAGIDEMLSKGISFSLYMTHGGTSFGHWAGANSPGFAPDVTSYDYDAPINEYGLATPKYTLLRDVLQKYADKRLPAVPSLPAALISVPQFSLTEYAPLTAGITRTVRSRDVQTMEELDMGFGSMVYETSLPALDRPSLLTLTDAHDFAQVYVDGAYIGKIDRVKNEKSLLLPAVKEGARLTITLEAMGRINFGRAIKDFKGITEGVTVHTESPSGHELTYDLKQWTIGLIPDAYEDAVKALKAASPSEISPLTTRAGYYRGYFTLKKTGDTFLNTSAFGKGQVYVNGHALGRYWKIGPQQTLYVPGCWLKKGRNEVIVLDVVGPEADATLFAEDHPQLDELHLEKSNKHNDPGMRPDLNSATPVATGAFAAGNGWQTVRFGAPAKGRYLAIECRSTHQGDAVAIAELYALDGSGQRLSREPWTARYADSENEFGNHTLDKVFDLQESTYWQTEKGTSLPHLLVIDLGAERELTGIDYLPRAEQGAPGSVKDFAVFVY
jgi:beta-galactosidase